MGRKIRFIFMLLKTTSILLLSHLADFDINLSFEIDFIPLSKEMTLLLILDDKYLTVTAFPLEHRVPAFGFLFREKLSDRNIIKEKIEKYQISRCQDSCNQKR